LEIMPALARLVRLVSSMSPPGSVRCDQYVEKDCHAAKKTIRAAIRAAVAGRLVKSAVVSG
jgi:hypothetical protein